MILVVDTGLGMPNETVPTLDAVVIEVPLDPESCDTTLKSPPQADPI